jgi:hypothetical protein
MPLRILCVCLLVIVALPGLAQAAQDAATQPLLPKVAIAIESGVRSEQVDITYYIVGDFGGYSSFVQRLPNLRKYVINASVENKPAKQASVLVYAPGCQFSSFDIVFTSNSNVEERQFRCEPLGGVPITGYIDPHELPIEKPVDVFAEFAATWICHYFNLLDCMVPSFPLGNVGSIDPADGGRFEITVPDLMSDPILNAPDQVSGEPIGTIFLVLKDKSSGRRLGAIRPKDSTMEKRGLIIQQAYPSSIEFTFFR